MGVKVLREVRKAQKSFWSEIEEMSVPSSEIPCRVLMSADLCLRSYLLIHGQSIGFIFSGTYRNILPRELFYLLREIFF